MENDKAFAIYVVTLFACATSVITASVMAGIATVPTPFVFAEHLAMSFGFRAAYKSFGGFDWINDVMPVFHAGRDAVADRSGATPDAFA